MSPVCCVKRLTVPTQLLVSFDFMVYSRAILSVSGWADIKTGCTSSQQDNLSQRLCHSPVLPPSSQVYFYLLPVPAPVLCSLSTPTQRLWATIGWSVQISGGCAAKTALPLSLLCCALCKNAVLSEPSYGITGMAKLKMNKYINKMTVCLLPLLELIYLFFL